MTEQLVGYLSYQDAPAAIRWLEALGFVATARNDTADGRVAHSELRRGPMVVMLASDDASYDVPPLVHNSTGQGLYIATDDVTAMYEAAIAAGGRSVFPPETTEWGALRARVLDPGGREWSFGTYRPGGGE